MLSDAIFSVTDGSWSMGWINEIIAGSEVSCGNLLLFGLCLCKEVSINISFL